MPETPSRRSSVKPPRPPSVQCSMQTRSLRGDNTVISSSQISGITPSGTPFISDSDGDFELMHVKVTVLGLTGLVCETLATRKRKSLRPKSRNTQASTVSSLSSSEGSAIGDSLYYDNIPTVAIAAFQRNVTNSATVIATHLPSRPIGMPVSSFGSLHRYIANWPTESNPFVQQHGEVDMASFTLMRVMMRDTYAMGDLDNGMVGSSVAYATETIDIHIGLGRGYEMVPLGVASIVITGDEEGAELMVLPVKPIPRKGGSMKLGSGGKKRRPRLFKPTKKAYFPDNPSRLFRLDENASLRVLVKVLPSYAVNAAEAALADMSNAEAEGEAVYTEDKENNNDGNEASSRFDEATLLRPLTLKEKSDVTPKLGVSFFNQSLFCGCAPLGQDAPVTQEMTANSESESASTGDSSVENHTGDSSAHQNGASFNSSDVSSVSDSESETDESEFDPEVHLNRSIFFKKKPSFRQHKSNKEIQAARATLRKQAQRLGVKPKDLL